MDVVLPILVMAMPVAVVASAVTPPLIMGVRRSWSLGGVTLWVVVFPLLAAWVVAGVENMDWADRTGGAGNAYAGAGWLVAAIAAATGPIWLTIRRGRVKPELV